MASPNALPEEQAWALCGGKLEISKLPRWVQTDGIAAVGKEFETLGSWATQGYDASVTIALTNSVGLRCNAIRCFSTGSRHICGIPVGLVLRLDYLLRTLERHAGKPNIHISDPDFYGDSLGPMKQQRDALAPPEPFRTLVDDSLTPETFWEVFQKMEIVDERAGKSAKREVQIDQLCLAVMFCALHEAAHALRAHSDIDRANDPERVVRGMELDADARSGAWVGLYRMNELFSEVGHDASKLSWDSLLESSWHITYGIALVLGLFDINHLAIGQYLSGVYHHPSARLQIAINGMFTAFASVFERAAVKTLVVASGEAASEYMSRATHAWKEHDPRLEHRRCTSLYFPFTGGQVIEDDPGASPTLRTLFRQASSEYERFLDEHQAILDSRLRTAKPDPIAPSKSSHCDPI